MTPLVDDGGDGPDVALLGFACYVTVVLCLRHLTRTHLQRADPGSADGGDDGARAAVSARLLAGWSHAAVVSDGGEPAVSGSGGGNDAAVGRRRRLGDPPPRRCRRRSRRAR